MRDGGFLFCVAFQYSRLFSWCANGKHLTRPPPRDEFNLVIHSYVATFHNFFTSLDITIKMYLLYSCICTVYTAAHNNNGKSIISVCIGLRAILWHFYWKDYERCCNSRSVINIMCFDFSICATGMGSCLDVAQGFICPLGLTYDSEYLMCFLAAWLYT